MRGRRDTLHRAQATFGDPERYDEEIYAWSQPLSTRACGLSVSGRFPGSRAYPSAPSHLFSKQWLRVLTRYGWHPRSQWRVRAGFSPASLHLRPSCSPILLAAAHPCSRHLALALPPTARSTAALTGDTGPPADTTHDSLPKVFSSFLSFACGAYPTSLRSLSASASALRCPSSRIPAPASRRRAWSRSSERPNVSAAFTCPSFRYQVVNSPSS